MTKRQQGKLLDDIFLQPWFVPLHTAVAIRRLLPPHYVKKMRNVFDDYGCLRCAKKMRRYAANGMCKSCLEDVKIRCALSLKRRGIPASRAQDYYALDSVKDAKRLLRDII